MMSISEHYHRMLGLSRAAVCSAVLLIFPVSPTSAFQLITDDEAKLLAAVTGGLICVILGGREIPVSICRFKPA